MSPSELDIKAPSVPPHPFKVGDKVRLKGHSNGEVYEVIPGKVARLVEKAQEKKP